MKLACPLAAFCIYVAVVPLAAQTAEGIDALPRRDVRWEAGLRAGGFASLEKSYGGQQQLNNLHGILGGAVVRMRSGNHHRFGLELAAHHGISEQSFTQVWTGIGLSETGVGFRKRSSDIALQGQFHPGREEHAVRPFVGLGLGTVCSRYTSENVNLEYQLNGFNMYSAWEPLVQIEQGLNWHLGSNLYLSQSLNFRHEMHSGNSVVSLRFGLLYGL